MGLDLDRHNLNREEYRAKNVALNHIKTLDSLVTPRIAQALKAQSKSLVKQLLSADELRELADSM